MVGQFLNLRALSAQGEGRIDADREDSGVNDPGEQRYDHGLLRMLEGAELPLQQGEDQHRRWAVREGRVASFPCDEREAGQGGCYCRHMDQRFETRPDGRR